jgi:hyperosmotically inducible periplasmic protein
VESDNDTGYPRGRRGFMTAILRSVTVVLAIVLLTAACQSATGKSTGTTVDDATITASVKSRLVADKPANLTRVDVDTNNGTVYLNGTVESAEQKVRAEALARQAKGVKTVVNNLQVLRK